MKLQKGDKVRYLNSVGGGVVVEVIDNKTVKISDDIGFEVPALMSELVKVDAPAQPSSSVNQHNKTITKVEEIEIEPENETQIAGNDFPALLFALVPSTEEHESEVYRFYLINDCNYHFTYQFGVKKDDLLQHKELGTLESNTKMFVGKYSAKEIQSAQAFLLQGFFFKTKKADIVPPVQKDIRISPIKLFKKGSFKQNDFFDEKALIIDLIEQDLKTALERISPDEVKFALKEKESARKQTLASNKENKEIKNFVKEVDLHIHELIDDETGLNPTDKLNLQLQQFENELNDAISKGIRKIVFIHGVGNGVLKLKIRNILEKRYAKYEYQDASFQKYKYGATLVSLH